MTFFKKVVVPFFIVASSYSCTQENLDPVDINVGGSGGIVNAGGAGGKDCIENNPGPGIREAIIKHYIVNGETVKEVSKDIFDPETGKGFTDPKTGKLYAGSTSCNFYPLPSYDSNTYIDITSPYERYCTDLWITKSNVRYKSVVKLPRWNGCDYCWDLFLNGLTEHERGKVDICINLSDELEEDIANIEPFTVCEEWQGDDSKISAENALFDTIDWLVRSAEKDYLKLGEAYIEETNHGETQGAVLDPNCDESQ